FSPSHIPYTILGEWYLDQYNQAAAEYNVVKDNPKTARAVKDKLAERWQILADRALEAYAHAYTLASKNRVKIPDTVGKIKTVLIELYRLRKNADDSELNAFAESLSKKPITDPAITVNP
ncbi:MAG: hypothetical protein ABI954_02005, partial [Pyrinomonadaceae bacterium]